MLALVLTVLATAFILGPDLLSRLVLSFVVPRRSVTQSRSEEVTRAMLWAALPLWIAYWWVHSRHIFGFWGTWDDVRDVFAGLYSNTFFDSHRDAFFHSLPRVMGMVASLLWRVYLIVLFFAVVLAFAILRFRRIRSILPWQWSKSMLATIVLPRVSEWHILLSDMLLPKEDVDLAVDVLTRSGTLYQGGVRDKMLAADGSLLTITLSSPSRFRREEYHKAKETHSDAKPEDYWRSIPSKLFVISGSDIANVNVRYLPKLSANLPLTRLKLSVTEIEAIRDLLSKLTT